MMKKIVPLLIFFLVILACSFPASGVRPSPIAVAQILVTHNPNGTFTPTPFQPVGPSQTPSITFTPVDTLTPTPTIVIDTPTPTPWYNGLSIPEGQIKIMVMGNDWRPASGYRTDVMTLITINPQQGTVTSVSFPRDLYVDIPGVGMNRLNTAMAFGGFWTFADTLQNNFGVRPDYYIMTNFMGFVSAINTMGGIEVNAAQNITDRCDLPQQVDGYCSVGPGTVYMDGDTALWYVRSRHSSSDFDRTRREQEVIYAIFQRMLNLEVIARAPDLYNIYLSSVETNIPSDLIFSLIQVLPQLVDSSHIRRYYIGPSETSNYVTETGAMVLLPDYYAIQGILYQAIFTP
jgi:polyisoprenyl-teichoic acid--peptidoglycan teichoic acid transferase